MDLLNSEYSNKSQFIYNPGLDDIIGLLLNFFLACLCKVYEGIDFNIFFILDFEILYPNSLRPLYNLFTPPNAYDDQSRSEEWIIEPIAQ